LGGPVGTLSGLGELGPAVAAAFAGELGLADAPIAWHARRAAMAETGTMLATLLGALAKMAGDVAHLASTEVGELAEPHVPGRGGSSAMPHKRNPVSCTLILAAASAARGLCLPLLESMAAAHERPAGAWHAEWHALPQLFGLASGALHEAVRLAEGLVIDEGRMRANIDAAHGLVFADAAAGLLARTLGREKAHGLVEQAADMVRTGGGNLRDVLAARAGIPDADLGAAFDIAPAVAAAARWVEPACEASALTRARLSGLSVE
jgi:3-carboxy-cis,cis-muconate cycloisomerase